MGKSYMAFCRGNMDQIEKKIKDDLWVQGTFEVNKFFWQSSDSRLAVVRQSSGSQCLQVSIEGLDSFFMVTVDNLTVF